MMLLHVHVKFVNPTHLLMRMTIVVMMAARNTNPPNTPRAIMPPARRYFCDN